MARVRVENAKSKWVRMKEGLPQGAVSSPTLFLLYVNDWRDYKEEGVEYSGFADDLAIWSKGNRVEELKHRMQRALQKIERWAELNKIALNPRKCESCLFTRSNGEKGRELELRVEGHTIPTTRSVKFLGVIVDQGLVFKEQVERMESKVKNRVRVLKALAGSDWGWDRDSMKKIYKIVVESCFWHASTAWMPWLSRSNLERLERVQREGLRYITGLTATAPVECVYLESGCEPLGVEGKRRALCMYEKAMRGRNDDPLKYIGEKKVKRRLKANKGWREQAKAEANRLELSGREMFSWVRNPPWDDLQECGVEVHEEMQEPVSSSTSKEESKRIAEETVEGLGAGVIIFTDGSVSEGVGKGGAACVMRMDGRQIVRRKAAGRWCSSYSAEVKAMMEALVMIEGIVAEKVAVVTDSQALIRRLRNRKPDRNKEVEELRERLCAEGRKRKIVIQWVPGHVGVEGNEWADREAKIARMEDQKEVCIGFEVAKGRIKRNVKYKPQLNDRLKEVYSEKIMKRAGSRREQVVMVQLRAGHCPLTEYYKQRVGEMECRVCDKCGQNQSKDHWLDCDGVRKLKEKFLGGGLCSLVDEEGVGRFLCRAYPEWWGPGRN